MAGPILSKKTSRGGNTFKVPPWRLWPDVDATVSLLKQTKNYSNWIEKKIQRDAFWVLLWGQLGGHSRKPWLPLPGPVRLEWQTSVWSLDVSRGSTLQPGGQWEWILLPGNGLQTWGWGWGAVTARGELPLLPTPLTVLRHHRVKIKSAWPWIIDFIFPSITSFLRWSERSFPLAGVSAFSDVPLHCRGWHFYFRG